MPSHAAISLNPLQIPGKAGAVGRTAWRRRVVTALLSVPRLIAYEVRVRRDERLLADMADHELADVGICRLQITDAVRTGRISAFRTDRS